VAAISAQGSHFETFAQLRNQFLRPNENSIDHNRISSNKHIRTEREFAHFSNAPGNQQPPAIEFGFWIDSTSQLDDALRESLRHAWCAFQGEGICVPISVWKVKHFEIQKKKNGGRG
jgi:hypothetical protein